MKVIEHINRATSPIFSYEIIPPRRGKSAQEIIDIVEQIQPYNPPYIDVTSHSADVYFEEKDGVIHRHIKKKRPGTISICGIIQNRFSIDTVAHLLCNGFTREETEDALIELNFLGIQNVLAIRGDQSKYKKPTDKDRHVNNYAADLVVQLMQLKKAEYIDNIFDADPIDMCVGVAGYPEKHFEAPNLKTDIQYLKKKMEAGAEYIVTQMFYDNSVFFNFVDKCREAGITIPIIPGIKILDRVKQLKVIPKNFHVNFPEELVDEITSSPEYVKEIGKKWGLKQCEELLNAGVKNIHFYVLNDAGTVTQIVEQLDK